MKKGLVLEGGALRGLYNEEIAYVQQREQEGKAFVIRPKERLPIKHLTQDTDLIQQVYFFAPTYKCVIFITNSKIRNIFSNFILLYEIILYLCRNFSYTRQF